MKKNNFEETVKYVSDFKAAYNALNTEYKRSGMKEITASYNAIVDKYIKAIKEYQEMAKQYKKEKEELLVTECKKKIAEYRELIKKCRKEQMAEFIKYVGVETPLFYNYRNALIQVIKIKMMSGEKYKSASDSKKTSSNDIDTESTNFSCNRAMVESLRSSSDFHYDRFISDNESYKETKDDCESDDNSTNEEDTCLETNNNVTIYETDDVLSDLATKIILKELTEQYFLYKDDAAWAFRSICQAIHNTLCDMVRKIPGDIPIKPKKDSKSAYNDSKEKKDEKTASYKTIYLDSTVTDEEGNSTTVGSMTADENQITEEAPIRAEMVIYAKNTFIHDVIKEMIPKPKYLLAYLNAVASRTGIELCNDIISKGFSSSLATIIALLKDKDIHVEYLYDVEFEWKDNINTLKKNNNIVNNWAQESRKIAQDMCVK